MQKKELPLLEFDGITREKLTPAQFEVNPKGLPEKCVIAFFRKEVPEVCARYFDKPLGEIHNCTAILPITQVNYRGEKIALVNGFIGSPNAASLLEILIAGGAKQFVVCGSAGVLTENPLGALVLPNSAVRDEGTSFHYAPPGYEIEADKITLENIEKTLKTLNVPYRIGKTWTTDAIFRETEGKIALRKQEGCLTVEMEAAAMMAVAAFRNVSLGYLLYCGDDLSKEDYDHRNFFDQADMRIRLIELALECVKNL